VKYAIDRYSVGAETEVSASDFEDQYIPGRRSRFYCPECGEIVFFRDKGGNNPSQFYHQVKTERTPECDKRVDGRSDLSLSQRVGLPVYLTGVISGRFQLNIGFPALGSEMLEKASSADYAVEISAGNQLRTIKVDQVNFLGDSITLVPVNFVPSRGKNYTITITGSKPILGLQRKWSDYADGFEIGGAVFSYDETGGKKVRRGDSISTNRSYYAVTKHDLPRYEQIHKQLVGKLVVGYESFNVVKIEVTASVDDKVVFSSISAYLYRHFGVWLLECQPELVPLWPPVVQRDYLIPAKQGASVICAVSSGNAEPNVYSYSNYGVQKKELKQDFSSVYTVDVTVGKLPVMLSVDRKYVGREVVFLAKGLEDGSYAYKYGVKDDSEDLLQMDAVTNDRLSGGFTFEANSKMEMYLGCKDKTYRYVLLREQESVVPAISRMEEIFLLVESGVVFYHRCESRNNRKWKKEELQDLLRVSQAGALVPLPRWAEYYIRSLRNVADRQSLDTVIRTISNGKIHAEALLHLRRLYLSSSSQIGNR